MKQEVLACAASTIEIGDTVERLPGTANTVETQAETGVAGIYHHYHRNWGYSRVIALHCWYNGNTWWNKVLAHTETEATVQWIAYCLKQKKQAFLAGIANTTIETKDALELQIFHCHRNCRRKCTRTIQYPQSERGCNWLYCSSSSISFSMRKQLRNSVRVFPKLVPWK